MPPESPLESPHLFERTCAVVIPAYQAASTLPALLQDISSRVAKQSIVVVDDGSTDATAAKAKQANVAYLRHPRNLGKGSALVTGLRWARRSGFTWAVTMDADGQHDPSELSRFIEGDVDDVTGVMVGTRPQRGTSMPLHRRFSNYVTTGMISFLAGQDVHDAQSGYRMYRTEIVDHPRIPKHGRFEWEAQILVLTSRLGYRLKAVPISTRYAGQKSHMRLLRDTMRFLKMYWGLAWID